MDSVKSGAESTVEFAKRAKTGLLAGGAAAAGLAATLVVTRQSRQRPKVLGIQLPRASSGLKALSSKGITSKVGAGIGNGFRKDTTKIAHQVSQAADRADQVAQRVSTVARNIRDVSDSAGKAANKA